MDGIRAGVTLMQDFCVARSSEFQSYIDYMAREEAQRNQAFQTFNVFHDYMENPEKSTGLFTATKDHLTMDEKKELKEIFQTAQDNESLMWQTVISFDNRWLEKIMYMIPSMESWMKRNSKKLPGQQSERCWKKRGWIWRSGQHLSTIIRTISISILQP